jgi:hypothetical protein
VHILIEFMQKLVASTVNMFAVFGMVSIASADVQVTIGGGRVTVVAKDATVREILAEWAKVGQAKIINVERIPGGPITLELTDVPERQALDVLLSSISGYVAASRTPAVATMSVFDRIIVIPTGVAATPSAAGNPAPAPAFPQPAFPQPFPQPGFQPAPAFTPPTPGDDQEEDRPTPIGAPQNRSPVFVFPQPQVNPQQGVPGGVVNPNLPQQFQPPQLQPPVPAAPATAFPGAVVPSGVSVPGMVAPAPQPVPGQPVIVYPGQPQPQPQR